MICMFAYYGTRNWLSRTHLNLAEGLLLGIFFVELNFSIPGYRFIYI